VLDRWGSIRCLRDIHHEQVAFAWPVTVVGGDRDHLLAAQLAGSVGMVPDGYPDDLDRVLQQVDSGVWHVRERAWQWTNCLHVLQPDQWWGTSLMWTAATGEFLCWYVDFRAPLVRSGDSLNTRDLQLDIVISPDGTWQWKDEDHYQFSVDTGFISADERAAVDASRESVVAQIEAGRFPFDGALADFALPAELPTLPPGWADP
jgi:protein associated with RNAse G/E